MQTEEILVEETIESQSHTKTPRAELVAMLRERDGAVCMFPGCHVELDFTITDGPFEVTIDHWIPQHYGKANGWTWEQIWDLSNLKLMHKKCNAKKGDRIPFEDGTLPERRVSTFRFRRQKRATRPECCDVCDNGHELAPDEVCASCGSNAKRFPRWAKEKASQCDHELFWCIWCSIGVIERSSSISIAMRQAESGEWGTDSERADFE